MRWIFKNVLLSMRFLNRREGRWAVASTWATSRRCRCVRVSLLLVTTETSKHSHDARVVEDVLGGAVDLLHGVLAQANGQGAVIGVSVCAKEKDKQ